MQHKNAIQVWGKGLTVSENIFLDPDGKHVSYHPLVLPELRIITSLPGMEHLIFLSN